MMNILLVKYVPRILHDDGMIAFAEVAHYDHLDLKKYYLAAEIEATFKRLKDERDYAIGSRDQWEIVAKDRQITVNDLKVELELAKAMNAQLRQSPHQWLPSASDQERQEP